MRHPPPKHYDDWLKIATNPPKICHSCDNYNQSGICLKFNMQPPEDFAGTLDACDEWLLEVGF